MPAVPTKSQPNGGFVLSENASTLHEKVMSDLAALRAGDITPAEAKIRCQLAKIALDALKIEILSGPGRYGYVRVTEQ